MKPYAIIAGLFFSFALAFSAVHGTSAHAAEIRVLSSNGVHSITVEMVPEFERATGHKVSIDYYTANQVLGRIKGGDYADLVIITRPAIEDLIKQGKVAPGGARIWPGRGWGSRYGRGCPSPTSVQETN